MPAASRNWRLAIAGSFYFFLLMSGLYVLKPLRDSSFLSQFDAHAKPVFNLLTLILLFVCASLYSHVVKKVQGARFIQLLYTVLIVCLIGFWICFEALPKSTGFVFYTWLSCANIFVVTLFWTQINSSFNSTLHTHHPKYLYVVIGLGGSLGAMLGGQLTQTLIPFIGSENLILAAAVIFFFAFLCSSYMASVSLSHSFAISEPEHKEASFKSLLKHRYALCLFALVMIGTFVQSIYDYQLTSLVQASIGKDKDMLLQFYSSLYARMNHFSFWSQLLLGPLLLYGIGPARGMYLMFFLILGTSGALLYKNTLPVMEWVFIVFAGSGYSLLQLFREQLYLPTSNSVKISFKGFIDTFGFRLGDTIAAVAFVCFVTLLGFDIARLDYLVMISGIMAIYFLLTANRIYRQMHQDLMCDKG